MHFAPTAGVRFVSTAVALSSTLSMINDATKVSCSKSGYAHNSGYVQGLEMAVHRINSVDVHTKLVVHNGKIAR